MSGRHLVYVIGAVVAATGAAMMGAAATALLYREWGDALLITLAALLTFAAGTAAAQLWGSRGILRAREGFAAVGLSWFAISAFGMLPYIFTGEITDVTNAFFETAAGFTTTGSSIVPDPSLLPHGILLWRALTQWVGGMGIIVLSVAILPLLGVGGVQLARAESPGPTPDRLTPRFRETAKRLWFVYLVLTLAEVAFLAVGEMTLFESVAHTFTTMSTGGFGTEALSLGAFDAYSQWVIIVFMVLAGMSFALHFRAVRRPLDYVRHPEARLYALILVGAAAFIVVGTWGGAVLTTIREGVFTAVSIVTTTGYHTADFALWSAALQILVIGLMFVGGMAGSTAGSVKTYRLAVLSKASVADLRRVVHPRGVFVTRFGREEVADDIVESVQSFFLLYMFLFMTGTVVFGVITSAMGSGFDLVADASAVATALGNVGPGLSDLGPNAGFAAVPWPGKWLLSFLMIVGRLEIFPVVLLFTRDLWRK